MALNPSNSSNVEQLALKGLNVRVSIDSNGSTHLLRIISAIGALDIFVYLNCIFSYILNI